MSNNQKQANVCNVLKITLYWKPVLKLDTISLQSGWKSEEKNVFTAYITHFVYGFKYITNTHRIVLSFIFLHCVNFLNK